MSKKRLVCLAGVLVSALLLAGCPPTLKISQIQKDPGKYVNKEITVHGKVTRAFGAMGMGIFQIDDGTGEGAPALAQGPPRPDVCGE